MKRICVSALVVALVGISLLSVTLARRPTPHHRQPSSRLTAAYLWVTHHRPVTKAERQERARVLLEWDRATVDTDRENAMDAQNAPH